MYAEDQLLPISALQHLIFCERQCALIHVERLWAENRWTVEGQHLHKKAHSEKTRTENGVRVARGLQLRSFQLGLAGQADVVEFHSLKKGSMKMGAGTDCAKHPEGRSGNRYPNPFSSVIPIEYKRGKPKKNDSDRVQLCAQAICLEEMLGIEIATGFLFYGKSKRRTEVVFEPTLRDRTASAAARLHEMIARRETPPAVREPKCDHCSLIELCLPDAMRFRTGASRFTDRELEGVLTGDGPLSDDFELSDP